MKRKLLFSIIILAGVISLSAGTLSRVDIQFNPIATANKGRPLHLELQVTNFSGTPIRQVRVFFRGIGDARFKYRRMRDRGMQYLADLNLRRVDGNLVEYFFDVEYIDGAHQSYPEEAPNANLLKTAIDQTVEADNGIVIISPEPDEEILTDEMLITVSFPRFSGQVDPERVRLSIDRWDVSRYVKVYDDFLNFAPRQVPPGKHTIHLELYNKSGKLLASQEWKFTAVPREGPAPLSPKVLNFNGNLYGEIRHESLLDGAQDSTYSRAGFNFNASNQHLSFGGQAFLSNQENKNLQPVNRFSGFFQLSFLNNRFIRVTGGDTYPQLNPFLLQNIFVRGGYAQIYLKFINIDALAGVTQRNVDGKTVITPDTTGGPPDTTLVPGTYRRKIWAVRPSFGARQNFQFGLTLMKGKDEEHSINFGPDPQENVGVGSDLFLAFNHQRIILQGSVNASFYNPNIRGGSVPFDTLKKKISTLDEGDRNLYDIAKKFITVNENLIIRPGLAGQAQVRLRYLHNSISAVYSYVEDDFVSLGQPYILRDNSGFSITDNIQMFRNQLFLSFGYRDYSNNLQNNKLATTDNQTIFVNVSYFPLANFPSLTFGYSNYKRDNGKTLADSLLITPEDNEANTVSFSSNYQFITGKLRHRATLTLTNYQRTDRIFVAGDNSSNNVAFRLQTDYRIPLRTTLEIQFMQSEAGKGNTGISGTNFTNRLEVNSFGGGLEYSFLKLLGQNDALTFSANGSYGKVNNTPTLAASEINYNRLFLNGRLVYTLPKLGRLSINGDLIRYTGDRDYQDTIVTARYDVSF